MRIPPVVTALSIGFVVATLPACSSGSKHVDMTTSKGAGTSLASAAGSHSATTAASAISSTNAIADGGNSASTLDACSLLSAARASSLVGKTYASAVTKTIATGQDQCTYDTTDNSSSLVVVVYQPSSGVSWQMLKSVLSDTGAVTPVSGVGDRAMVGPIELDVQTGEQLVAIQGAGGTVTGNYSKVVEVAKSVVAGLK